MKNGISKFLKRALAAIGVSALVYVACNRNGSMSPASPTPAANPQSQVNLSTPAPLSTAAVVFTGAGDIASCGGPAGTEATARLIERMPGFVFSLGDNVYPSGTAELFENCYGPSWGRFRARTYPTPGNHDWDENAGAPYFAYFGASAGPAGVGYYSFDLGAWHILSLNSNVGTQPGSPQYEWAKKDLASNGATCALALWHHPLFNSGHYGGSPHVRELWRLLDTGGVEIALNGHEHAYERFAPQDADGRPTPAGIREFVVGTGGVDLRPVGTVQPNSEVRNNDAWGVLKLTLRATAADWEFVPVDGQSFRDSGTVECSR
jgi:hypothetical protein